MKEVLNLNSEYEFQNHGVEAAGEMQFQVSNGNLEYMRQKYFDDSSRLRVYVNEEENKYYILVFAASSLGLIDYAKAAKLFDNGKSLFEITPETLHILNTIFKDRLDYVSLSTKKSIMIEDNGNYNNFDYDEYFFLNNNKNARNKR